MIWDLATTGPLTLVRSQFLCGRPGPPLPCVTSGPLLSRLWFSVTRGLPSAGVWQYLEETESGSRKGQRLLLASGGPTADSDSPCVKEATVSLQEGGRSWSAFPKAELESKTWVRRAVFEGDCRRQASKGDPRQETGKDSSGNSRARPLWTSGAPQGSPQAEHG